MAPSLVRARLMLVCAAVLWSTSSLFIRTLQAPGSWHLHEPELTPLQLAFFRSVFAGICLIPMLRRQDLTYRPAMLLMVLCFGAMTGLYISALALGQAANAIFLQNTAPVWVYILGVYVLGHAPDRKTLWAIVLAVIGALTIVLGNWPQGLQPAEQSLQATILLMATGSGVLYAGVILFLGHLRGVSSTWLTVLNMLGSAGVLLAYVLLTRGVSSTLEWIAMPTAQQLVFVAVFGFVQMAAPYWLFTQGLRTVSPQEAGIITLIEPILNPCWAYWIAPERETPTVWTLMGGFILLAALGWRYWPRRRRVLPEKPIG